MFIQSNALHDKVEIFESSSIADLEKRIELKVIDNQAILLEVNHVAHQLSFDPVSGKKIYTAIVHFKKTKETN